MNPGMDAIAGLQRAARWRGVAIGLARWLPVWMAALLVVHRIAGTTAAIGVAALGALLLAIGLVRHWRRLDAAWVARRLDARRRDLDDSAALLYAAPESLAPLVDRKSVV